MAKPLLTNSSKEGDGIVQFPHDSIVKYLSSKLAIVAIKEDLQLLHFDRSDNVSQHTQL